MNALLKHQKDHVDAMMFLISGLLKAEKLINAIEVS